MSVWRRKYFVRLFVAFCGAVLLLAIGVVPIKKLLPADRIYHQDFIFRVTSPSSFDDENWRCFVLQQELDIYQLARRHTSELCRKFKIISEAATFKITLVIRCPQQVDMRKRWAPLLSSYVEHRQSTEETRTRATAPESSRGTEKGLKDWLEKLDRKHQQLRQNLEILQAKYKRMAAELVDWKRFLSLSQPPVDLADFEIFLSAIPLTENGLADCAEWEQLQKKQHSLDRELAQLDIRSGRCFEEKELQEIKKQREKKDRERQQLQKECAQKKAVFIRKRQQQYWPQYQETLKKRMRKNENLMAVNAEQRFLVNEIIRNHQEQIDLARSLISSLPTRNPNPSSLLSSGFCPRLQLPLPAPLIMDTLSYLQWLALVLLGLLGAGLGVIFYNDLISRKIRLVNTAPPSPLSCPQLTNEDEQVLAVIDPEQQPYDITSTEEINQTEGGWTPQYDQAAKSLITLRDQVEVPAVLITGMNPADVSPRVVVNLAIALTRRGYRILLVEADVGIKPLAAIFEQTDTPGFFEWRRGEIWSSQAIVPSHLPHLSFLPVGTASSDQCNLELDISRESHRWANLRRNFDLILIYAPAALSVDSQKPEEIAVTHLLDLTDFTVVLSHDNKDISLLINTINSLLENHQSRFEGLILLKS